LVQSVFKIEAESLSADDILWGRWCAHATKRLQLTATEVNGPGLHRERALRRGHDLLYRKHRPGGGLFSQREGTTLDRGREEHGFNPHAVGKKDRIISQPVKVCDAWKLRRRLVACCHVVSGGPDPDYWHCAILSPMPIDKLVVAYVRGFRFVFVPLMALLVIAVIAASAVSSGVTLEPTPTPCFNPRAEGTFSLERALEDTFGVKEGGSRKGLFEAPRICP